MNLVKPKTYPITNAEGEKIGSVTAADALNFINPNQVSAKIDEINNLVDTDIKKIKKVLTDYAEDSDEAMIIEGASMKKPIEEFTDSIEEVPGAIKSSLEELKNQCEQAHKDKQQEYNEEAEAEAERRSG